METADLEREVFANPATLVPEERVTGVRMGDGYIVIYFDPERKEDGANRLGAAPLPWSAGYGPIGRIIDTVA